MMIDDVVDRAAIIKVFSIVPRHCGVVTARVHSVRVGVSNATTRGYTTNSPKTRATKRKTIVTQRSRCQTVLRPRMFVIRCPKRGTREMLLACCERCTCRLINQVRPRGQDFVTLLSGQFGIVIDHVDLVSGHNPFR